MAEEPKSIRVYNLGEKGVQLTKSPIHLEDGELVSAQNAEFYREQGQGALRKRPALRRHNSSALAGTVTGIGGVPLPAPGARELFVNRSTNSWLSTADGTTWETSNARSVELINSPQAYGTLGVIGGADSMLTVGQFPGRFYFPGTTGTTPYGSIHCFDGTANYIVLNHSVNNGLIDVQTIDCVGPMFLHYNKLVIGLWGFGFPNEYIEFNTLTGEVTRIGGTFVEDTENPLSGCSYLGKVWVGTTRATTGRLYYARSGDTSWTLERTAAAGHAGYTSMAHYKGELYATTGALAGTAAIIEKRTVAGVWSTVRTGSHSTQANNFDGLIVFNGELYAFYWTDGATDISQIHKFDGSSWSTNQDLTAIAGHAPSGRTVIGNRFFVTCNDPSNTRDGVFRKIGTGAWTKVDSSSITNGYIGYL